MALPFGFDSGTSNSKSSATITAPARGTHSSSQSFSAVSAGLSVVIPTLNEEGNLEELAARIDRALAARGVRYELLFVDDFSADGTRREVESIRQSYPAEFHLKDGPPGKAHSLLQGFSCARYELLAMIDADLQYPPEALPGMVELLRQGDADIVVARRKSRRTTLPRRLSSGVFSFIFARLLHGMTCDVQSGLKVFRREVFDAVSIEDPTPWTFDLDFLLQARSAGFRTAETDIVFEERHAGRSKVGLLAASSQIGWSAVRLKIRRSRHRPESARPPTRKEPVAHRQTETNAQPPPLPPQETALRRMLPKQFLVIVALLLLVTAGVVKDWQSTVIGIIAAVTVFYFCDLAFSLYLIYQAFARSELVNVDRVPGNADRDWPSYTILCPLYHEREVLPQFVTAITRLDYPKDRLEVLLLLEENDDITLDAARELALPSYFHVVIVPHSQPKTKPKACNYGLAQATGTYVVIYDAEDVPDPQQLKKAVLAFEQSPPTVACIQARLNFYNPNQNLLTRLFAAEYSLWFDLILPGLQACDCPIPLGGTSNHFERKMLEDLGGWDAFNVTEDCDLGVRLAKRGFRTAILDSTTLEEANSELRNWFPQRTRWLKGYIQTYFVHMRTPRAFGARSWLEPKLWAFQLIVGGKVLSMVINPLLWALTFTYFALRPLVGTVIESFFPAPVLYLGVICLVGGNFLAAYSYMIGCARRGHDHLIKYALATPVYWVAISVAAWMAVYKFLRQPHYWAKTSHGLHLGSREGLAEAQSAVGQLVDRSLLAHRHVEDVMLEDGPDWQSPAWTVPELSRRERPEDEQRG